mmetsp:Transcript_34798/g.63370  ORF Transcript_34798/g.63370 Transcript_34798/m.63370 type:complete len:359 (+) Transcript_34798:71-1147(+)|eukprot:CAMPEP_0197654270 /NCGR_PEP_ID=MMETSP1338-20131121/38747_1 /TAXON_ID=43686 ORGANISM="Pelagodinium beii, Strain RCC1491" /NCGR_SAMPLE_ID=MMETSP1338 /ASSEMBLY_ACC=CAM_ASM_000754 /LENGTH=358 /DNA_ID=CAMNT_0043229679 /DNA_START=71 /DNA_END=1147 /DNA_ORIENTATION=-
MGVLQGSNALATQPDVLEKQVDSKEMAEVAAEHQAAEEAAVKAMGDESGEIERERIYVVGGLDSSFNAVASVYQFDPLQGNWLSLPPISNPCHGCTAAVACDRLYVLGGESSGIALADVQRFDPWETQSWEQLPPMSAARIKAAAIEHQGFLYVMGGLDGINALSSVERFDPTTRSWQELAPMQKPRYACSAAVRHDGRIVVVGGELTEAGTAASMEIYDPEENSWQLLPALRNPLCGASLVLQDDGDAVFSFGGLGLSGQALNHAEQAALGEKVFGREALDDNRGTKPMWCPLPPMFTSRQQISACSFQGGACLVGGKTITSEASNKVEYLAASGFWDELPPLPSARLRAAVVAGHI